MRKDSPKHFLNCNMSTSVTRQVVEVEEEEEELQSSSLLQRPLNGDGPAAATAKKKRNLPGNPDPDAEVVALSPRTLMATNRYMCEVCHKGFQRDQNLQLHRRGHNLPWKLKQRTSTQIKKRVYICPETSCVHHDPSRALGDLTGIKKHYCRKHGEKKWKCDKCSKCYAVQSDWKAHAKICGTKEYRCDCGTIFSRRDSFITHRAFCDALTEENNKMQQQQSLYSIGGMLDNQSQQLGPPSMPTSNPISTTNTSMNLTLSNQIMNSPSSSYSTPSAFSFPENPCASSEQASCIQINGCNSAGLAVGSSYMSATALLQKAAVMGAMISDNSISPVLLRGFAGHMSSNEPHGSVQDQTDASSGKSSQCGLLDSHLLVQQENIDFGNHLEGVFMDGVQSGGACDRTVDFLGLGPSGHLDIGDRSFNNNTIGLGYSDEQQNLHNMNSYHYISNDPTELEKSMWNF